MQTFDFYMSQIVIGTIIISLLHALIPSHWIPLVAFARLQKWSGRETLRVSFYLALSHVLSTVLLGILLGFVFYGLRAYFEIIFHWIGPIVLICSGFYFMYRHHKHHHFHIDAHMLDQTQTRRQIIYALLAYMFLSPCLEIEAYFINAGLQGWGLLAFCVGIYVFISVLGMLVWVYVAFRGMKLLNVHRIEHNAGIITGLTMVITGLLSFLHSA